MNYDAMKTAELQKLCKERGLRTSRAKADLIETLHRADEDEAFDELVELTEDLGLYDDVTASEPDSAPPVQESPEKPSGGNVWLEDGAFVHVFPVSGFLSTEQHTYFLRETETAAQRCGHVLRGEAFRVTTGFSDEWEYRVWVH